MPFVCVQPMQTSWARRTEDLTVDKTDEKDAVLIARLTAQLKCYARSGTRCRQRGLSTAGCPEVHPTGSTPGLVSPRSVEDPSTNTIWAATT
jgi:hypothetical protein